MKRILVVVALVWSVMAVGAEQNNKVLHPTIQLLNMKAMKISEKNGDDLFLSITAYPSEGKSTHYQRPKYPQHWPSAQLDQVKDVHVWDGDLNNGQAVTLIVSLIEQDTPPWNTHDLIGTVRIRMHNNQGKLESNWSMPNRVGPVTEISTRRGQVYMADLLGEGSRYELRFLPSLKKSGS